MNREIYMNVIQQLSQILRQLDNASYTRPLSLLNGSSVGQHTRHVIEFYRCLLGGVAVGIVDYDARERDLSLETSIETSLASLTTIMQEIETMDKPEVSLLLAVNYGQAEKSFVHTNFLRELVYLVEHSIHHYALMRVGLQTYFPNVSIPDDFGIAYSTIQHRSLSNA